MNVESNTSQVGDHIVYKDKHYRVLEVNDDGTLTCEVVIEILPGQWGTIIEAREWLCGGPVLPRDNATELADNLERLARELRG